MIHLLFTGGTISMQRDDTAGGNVPAHGGEALVEFAAGLEEIGPHRIEDWAMLPACHMGPDRLWQLRERVRQIAGSGEVRGIVLTHGTDTIEETAYLLDRTLTPEVPVAITGAMRTAGDDGWDGPQNLRDAAAVAASGQDALGGVMVVFNGKVLAGRTAVKVHTTDLDAFAAPHSGPIGNLRGGKVAWKNQIRRVVEDSAILEPSDLSARVALIPMIVGDDGRLLDLARPLNEGVVVIAFGSGNVPPGAVPAIGRWIDEGKPVVIASRCPLGQVAPMYAFDGGGNRLVTMGAVAAGQRTPSQARMELMIALSAGVEYGG